MPRVDFPCDLSLPGHRTRLVTWGHDMSPSLWGDSRGFDPSIWTYFLQQSSHERVAETLRGPGILSSGLLHSRAPATINLRSLLRWNSLAIILRISLTLCRALLFIQLRKTSTPHENHSTLCASQPEPCSLIYLSRVSLGLWMDVRKTGIVRQKEEDENKYVPHRSARITQKAAAFRPALDRSRPLAHRLKFDVLRNSSSSVLQHPLECFTLTNSVSP
ncbi:hypothetical protein K439DRAFT_393866 [Ramaria rubella]|nr:hypothetical protein K439DRAFT_393866 [Ramaria rubella]